jgi:hypothetical protein
MDDTLTAHLDAIEAEGGGFALARDDDKSGWTATGTRKGGRKELIATGETPLAAIAGLLALIRGEAEAAKA